jgi:hypothetical protein
MMKSLKPSEYWLYIVALPSTIIYAAFAVRTFWKGYKATGRIFDMSEFKKPLNKDGRIAIGLTVWVMFSNLLFMYLEWLERRA